MQITKHSVVSIDYTLTDDAGTVIDSSQGGAPLAYIQGIGQIIPGLENALEGRAVGDALTVKVQPGEGYGERDDALVQVVSRGMFGEEDVQVGMQFRGRMDDGTYIFTVVGLEGDEVTIDGNHPLAGMPLNFDVKVVGVRTATEEELSHGHVHGEGDHHHED